MYGAEQIKSPEEWTSYWNVMKVTPAEERVA